MEIFNKGIGKDLLILSELRKNARMKLTAMSRETRIPVSTIFDRTISFKEKGLVRKYTSLVRFEKLGYMARVLIMLSCNGNDKEKLGQILERHQCLNSLYKINNGWNYMAEMIFIHVKDVEEFMDSLQEKVRIKNKAVFYIIDELRKEHFLSNSNHLKLSGELK